MIKQPVKLALSDTNNFRSSSEYLKARKEASKKGNRLIRHKYKQELGKEVEYENFDPIVVASVYG